MTDRHVYSDTSALMRFAEGSTGDANERNAESRALFQSLIDHPGTVLATSETAIIEFHDALGRDVRNTQASSFDEQWFERSATDVMQMISDGRLEVLQPPPKAIESSLVLMRIAHSQGGIAFKAWDAMHFIAACSWAIELGRRVEIATSDSDFTRFCDSFPHFDSLVEVLMVA